MGRYRGLTADSVYPSMDFRVKLTRRPGSKLGLSVSNVSSKSQKVALAIKEIKAGIVDEWNNKHPEAAIKVGDFIIRCNGIHDDGSRILEAVTRSSELDVTFRRFRS